MPGGRVFISYRRDDSRADSGRLYDRLNARFPGRVFRDVASLNPGVEWDDAIARALSQTAACIVVVGRNWLDITDEFGNRRLDDPADVVRQEIAAVLRRPIPVFPLLVGGARMPAAEDLPPDLQTLSRWQAIDLHEQYWDEGVQKLIQAIEGAFAQAPRKSADVPPRQQRRWWLPVLAIAIFVIALVLYVLTQQTKGGAHTESGSPGAFQFAGSWRAVVITSSRADQDLDAYPDQSFRLAALNKTLAVGKWRYNATTDTLEAYDVTNLANNDKYSCSWKDVSASHDSLSGTCVDRINNGWSVSLSRAPGHEMNRSYNLPRVDLSGLTTAEKAAFSEYLGRSQCQCGMTLLVCLRKHPACPYSPSLAQTALANFERSVH